MSKITNKVKKIKLSNITKNYKIPSELFKEGKFYAIAFPTTLFKNDDFKELAIKRDKSGIYLKDDKGRWHCLKVNHLVSYLTKHFGYAHVYYEKPHMDLLEFENESHYNSYFMMKELVS